MKLKHLQKLQPMGEPAQEGVPPGSPIIDPTEPQLDQSIIGLPAAAFAPGLTRFASPADTLARPLAHELHVALETPASLPSCVAKAF